MKKAIGIIILGLLLSGNAYALSKCTGKYGSLLSFAWTNCYGKAIFDDGGSYEGVFYNEKAHGKGVYIFSNGDRVEGEFNNGIAHGWATMIKADGNKYVGDFRSGKFDGEGTYTASNGDKYFGEWANGVLHGKATITFANGEVKQGIFENGEFVKEVNFSTSQNTGGKIIFENCDLTPNFSTGATITIDLGKKSIKVFDPKQDGLALYDIKETYGDVIVSTDMKYTSAMTTEDLKTFLDQVGQEFSFDLENKTVSLIVSKKPGIDKKFSKYIDEQINSGEMKLSIRTSCDIKNR